MRWIESRRIERPVSIVQDAIADERVVMLWSAWPDATGYSCSVDGDGRSIGSEIVFRDGDGAEQGRQRLVNVEPGLVQYRLRNRGPGGRMIEPEVDFRLESDGAQATVVHLDFRLELPLPGPIRPVIGAILGPRVRGLHRRDLESLAHHLEAA